MAPTIGRTVIYTPATKENEAWEKDPVMNTAKKLPAVIVCVWSDECVNLRVFCDGDKTLWVTSANKGDGEGQWNWPVIEK